jgi:hypothetical protein
LKKLIKNLHKNEKEKLEKTLNENHQNFIFLSKIEECILNYSFFDKDFDNFEKNKFRNVSKNVKDNAFLTKKSLDNFILDGKNI